jgi:regulator of protease activity HflC (stomatin/prohibitin superfamily)
MHRVIVKNTHRGALYEDGVFQRVLDPGVYRIWPWPLSWTTREIVRVDIRNRSMTLKGQEILTADKVAVRISLLVNYRVTDVEAALHNVDSFENRIYEDVQLSARRFLAVKSLDEILKDRNEISEFVKEDVREAAAAYGVEITRADVKDLVFPGNLREIMNRVLETERRSEAMLIEAKKKSEAQMIEAKGEMEAVASKLEAEKALAEQIRDNPTLLRLKELEVLVRIAEKSGAKFYVGVGDVFKNLGESMKD